jgi:hypothetical protein
MTVDTVGAQSGYLATCLMIKGGMGNTLITMTLETGNYIGRTDIESDNILNASPWSLYI